MSAIHPGWLQGEPQGQPESDPVTETIQRVQRCLVCRQQFTPTYHLQHQVLCGSPMCKRIRHREISRRYERRRSARTPNDRPTTKHPGVYWRMRKKPWVAQIKIAGENIYLGSFETEEQAAEAFQAAAEARR